MLKYLIIVILTGLSHALPVSAQSAFFGDTLQIHSIRAFPDLRSGNAEGLRLNLHFSLQYDEKRHQAKKPVLLGIRIIFFQPDGKIVSAVPGTSYHVSDEGVAITGSEDMTWTNTKDLFMPYYAFSLPEGEHILRLKIFSYVKDSAVTEDPRLIFLKGPSETTVKIKKPGTRSFRIMVRELRVSPSNANGRAWDFSLFGSNEPDLMHRVVTKSKEHSDFRHTSSTVQDAFSAGWIDFSEPVIISVRDEITLNISDKDLLFDDVIGEISNTLDKWLEISAQKKPVSFGEVTSCLVELVEIRNDSVKPGDPQ